MMKYILILLTILFVIACVPQTETEKYNNSINFANNIQYFYDSRAEICFGKNSEAWANTGYGYAFAVDCEKVQHLLPKKPASWRETVIEIDGKKYIEVKE